MNLTQQSYRRIRATLLAGSLPREGRLSIKALATELGMGRSPVRDAVNRLAAEGLLDMVPKSGITVRTPGLAELRDIVGLREAIEPYAAAQACTRLDYTQLGHLRLLCRKMGETARRIRDAEFRDEEANRTMQALDWAFHELILKAAGNARLCRIVEDQHLLLRKVRYPSLHSVRHLALTLREHWRLCRALERGDVEAAREWMQRHARRGGNAILESRRELTGKTETREQRRDRR